ncbi:hypothetical protein SNEBB_005282 [Seison nebaliae]|nr:hypothetical protein SNEBB_005282 [Seison nebaliae]
MSFQCTETPKPTYEKNQAVQGLELSSAIGFDGTIPRSLKLHPNDTHLVYPLGCNIIIEDLRSTQQFFLMGHDNNITCLTISTTGKYLASGQETHMGFKADIIVWLYEEKAIHARLSLHKVKIEALSFSCSDIYLMSLGGLDDGSVVVWNVQDKEPVCGSPAQHSTAGYSYVVDCSTFDDNLFVTAGNQTLRTWMLDVTNRKIRPTDVNTGTIKRVLRSISMARDGCSFFVGSTTGDFLRVMLPSSQFRTIGPTKNKISIGITSLVALDNGKMLLIGGGDGTIALMTADTFLVKKKVKLHGAIQSLCVTKDEKLAYAGTDKSHINKLTVPDLTITNLKSCHETCVNDVQFPFGTSELFATCSFETIRIWHSTTNAELKRITIPNKDCSCISFMRDGKSIVSGWNDGKIRSFYPETGNLMYEIHDTHHKGVTALATTSDCGSIVSGGGEGMIRVWEISRQSQSLIATMKEHKNAVSCIKINKKNNECVTSSLDGTCIIWDLKRFIRNSVLFANTLFKTISYHPNEYHVITGGSDHKMAYWEVFDGTQIRELEASTSGSINGIDIDPEGEHLVTGSEDKLVKLWDYNKGIVSHVGFGHGGEITRVSICPLRRHIISVGNDGAILRWRFPEI